MTALTTQRTALAPRTAGHQHLAQPYVQRLEARR